MITYHPGTKVIDNISKIIAQVPGLVLVDNGSDADELDMIRKARQAFDFHLIENGENLGVAEALNRGILWATGKDYPWVLLFDQDSTLTVGFVGHMFSAWESHPHRQRVGSIHPRYMDPETSIELEVPRDSEGGPVLPMTSGALMPAWIFAKIGWFASDYFIDLVDWEYCFRIRASGYLVADAKQARLLHSPGNPASTAILGHTLHPTHHGASRRYYISRNSVVFLRKYLFVFPGWVLNAAHRQLHDAIVSLIAEGNRARKFRNMLLGVWDGLIGRMGRRDGL